MPERFNGRAAFWQVKVLSQTGLRFPGYFSNRAESAIYIDDTSETSNGLSSWYAWVVFRDLLVRTN